MFSTAEGTENSSDGLIREERGKVDGQAEEAGLTTKAKERAQHEEEEEEEQSLGVQDTPSHPEVQTIVMLHELLVLSLLPCSLM